MFLWPFVLFNSAASFTKQDFESKDSTLFFLVTTFSRLPLYFPRYTDPNVQQYNFILFRKVSTRTLATLVSFFAFLSRLVGILKLGAILSQFGTGRNLARNCCPSPRLLIESSPRFTNRVQSAFLLPSVARQLPILDVTRRSCFFVPSPWPSYIGETVLNPCQSVGCQDFSEIVVSSSIRRFFVFIRL